jgi:hypothetical protein
MTRYAAMLAVLMCFLAPPTLAKDTRDYPEDSLANGGMKQGPRSVANIDSNMARMLPRMYYRYSEARGPKSSLAGTMQLRFRVDRKGTITSGDVHQSTFKDETFEDLIAAILLQSTFDEWKDGKAETEIIYTVEFTKDKADSAPRSRSRKLYEKRLEKNKAAQDSTLQTPDTGWGAGAEDDGE